MRIEVGAVVRIGVGVGEDRGGAVVSIGVGAG